ncbi:MAG: LysR family transcriptional regulator [Acidovorax sp.]|uniref:LysR family transcriptional regulator n=1 Tax=Acidovorax sp. TaxID=1872122 RepID=UPI0025BE626F|nr:LysR family transcriptional regulator [Acidovorax sp.]MCE1194527.1 LysR family transcriptional regulator [Acidovorax sp.]
MTSPDLNLLLILDLLLTEGSVAGAARRLRLSPSAVSRALARLRDATGDPLLVRAGTRLVPTQRAQELREQVGGVVGAAKALLQPTEQLDLSRLNRDFTFRNRDGFVERFGVALVERIRREAPGVRLHFLAKVDRDSSALRDGRVDLETAVVGTDLGPELVTHSLFEDRWVGVVREGHPLGRGEVSLAQFANAEHVHVSHHGGGRGRIDDALQAHGMDRSVAVTVGTFSEALALARGSDLVATVPDAYTRSLRHQMSHFALPLDVPPFRVSLVWHPRAGADPAHRWLRQRVIEECMAG